MGTANAAPYNTPSAAGAAAMNCYAAIDHRDPRDYVKMSRGTTQPGLRTRDYYSTQNLYSRTSPSPAAPPGLEGVKRTASTTCSDRVQRVNAARHNFPLVSWDPWHNPKTVRRRRPQCGLRPWSGAFSRRVSGAHSGQPMAFARRTSPHFIPVNRGGHCDVRRSIFRPGLPRRSPVHERVVLFPPPPRKKKKKMFFVSSLGNAQLYGKLPPLGR